MGRKHIRLGVLVAVAVVMGGVLLYNWWSHSTDSLLGQAKSGETKDRLRAIEELDKRGAGPVVGDLAAMVRDEDTAVAVRTLDTVGRLQRAEDLPRLKEAAKDPRPEVREAGVLAVGRSRDAANAAFLIQVAQTDEKPEVRAAAVRAIGLRHDWEAMPQIIQAMDDTSVLVRQNAGVAVRRLWQRDFGYRAEDPPEKRKVIVDRIRLEWDALRSSPMYHRLTQMKTQEGRP